jgi:MoaA/NifB/PqqE/SkfB family radical SAM enzyme
MTRERTHAAAGRRPGPTYPTGAALALPVARLLGAALRYSVRRGRYPHFRLRALRALVDRRVLPSRRLTRLGRHYYYGTGMGTPRWPSPAFDRMIAAGGINLEPEVIAHRHHLDTAFLGITRRCGYRCEHCYDAGNRSEAETVDVERWVEVARRLERIGTSVIVLTGGEPVLRYDCLLAILQAHDARLSDLHLHTSGAGVTPARARELAERGLVAAGVGLDFPDAARHDRFRGTPGAYADAVGALGSFADAGIYTYTNLCLTPGLIWDGGLYRYLDLARELRVGAVHLLEPKPCGRYARGEASRLLTDEDRVRARAFFMEVNRSRRYRRHPPVAYPALLERPDAFGCLMGGVSYLAVDSAGDVQPCPFVPVSFGSILREEIDAILARMRAANPRPRYHECPAVLLAGELARRRETTGRSIARYEEILPQWRQCLTTEGRP